MEGGDFGEVLSARRQDIWVEYQLTWRSSEGSVGGAK